MARILESAVTVELRVDLVEVVVVVVVLVAGCQSRRRNWCKYVHAHGEPGDSVEVVNWR